MDNHYSDDTVKSVLLVYSPPHGPRVTTAPRPQACRRSCLRHRPRSPVVAAAAQLLCRQVVVPTSPLPSSTWQTFRQTKAVQCGKAPREERLAPPLTVPQKVLSMQWTVVITRLLLLHLYHWKPSYEARKKQMTETLKSFGLYCGFGKSQWNMLLGRTRLTRTFSVCGRPRGALRNIQ